MAMRFRTVPDSYRGEDNGQGRPPKDWTAAERKMVNTLLAGKTVFVSSADADVTDLYRLYQSFAHKEGRRLARKSGTYRNEVGFFLSLIPE